MVNPLPTLNYFTAHEIYYTFAKYVYFVQTVYLKKKNYFLLCYIYLNVIYIYRLTYNYANTHFLIIIKYIGNN